MGTRLRCNKSPDGFTLIELLLIVVIVVILAAVAVPQYFRYLDSARVTASISVMEALRKDLTAYNLHYGAYPARIDFTNFTDQNGNSVLTALDREFIMSKMSSMDSYVVAGEMYTITGTSNDSQHTVITLTPMSITR